MRNIKLILLLGIILSTTSCLLHHKQPADKLDFINSQDDVTDSLNTLRNLKRFIVTSDYVTNCYVGYHNELIINYTEIGDFEHFVNGGKVDMETVKQVYTGDIYRLISLMAYLNKNHINGFYVDKAYNIIVYPYREFEYGDRTSDFRLLLFKDEFIGKVKDEFIIKDESKELILAIYNMPPDK
jgi:hypothetical protein